MNSKILFTMMNIIFLAPTCSLGYTPWIDGRAPRKTVSMDYLYESCDNRGGTAGGDIAYFDCESYVYGVLDAYLEIRNEIPLNERACFPENLPPWLALKIAEPLDEGSAGRREAGPQIIAALRNKYPCQKSQATRK
jgi:hypothetical protein